MAVVLLLAACAAFGAGKYLEYAQVKRCNAFLARIPASWGLSIGTVSASLFGRSLTVSDIRFALPSREGALAVTMETITAEGIAFEKLLEAGKARLAESLVITNVRVTGSSFETSTEYCALTDVSGDPASLGTELGNAYLDGAGFLRQLGSAALADGAGTSFADASQSPFPYSAVRYVSRNDRTVFPFKGKSLEFFVASSDVADISGDKLGSSVFKDMQGIYDGRKFFSLAEFGLTSMELPREAPPLPSKTALGQNPFVGTAVLDGGYVKKLFFEAQLPDGNALPATLEEARLTGRFADERQTFAVQVTNLSTPKALLEKMASKNGMANIQEIAPFIPENVVCSGHVAMDITPLANGEVAFSFSPLAVSVREMGALSLAVEMQGREGMEQNAKVRLMDLSLTDSGGSELLFMLVGKAQGKTPSYLRRELRMGLSAAGLALQGPLADLAAHALDFLEKPGATLTVKLDPGQLTEAETLGNMLLTNPAGAGLSSSISREGPGERKP